MSYGGGWSISEGMHTNQTGGRNPANPTNSGIGCFMFVRYNYAHKLCAGGYDENECSREKRSTNVYLNAGLLEEAKELDLNVSAISNRALETAVRERKRER